MKTISIGKIKPNRKRHQAMRLTAMGSGEVCYKPIESERERKQRNTCLNCKEPECRKGYCERMRGLGVCK